MLIFLIIVITTISISLSNALKLTSSSLTASLKNLENISPELNECPIDCNIYIQYNSALGFNGPIGALG